MNLLTRFPLRVAIPFLLLLFALAGGGGAIKYSQNLTNAQEEKEALARVTQEMTQLQASIDDRLRKGDWEGVQAEIAMTGLNPDVTVAALVDDVGIIVGSTSRKLLGDSVNRALPDVDDTLRREVTANRTGKLSLSDDRRIISAYYPVVLGARSGEIRPHRMGTVYLRYDLTFVRAVQRYLLECQALVLTVFFVVCFLLLGIFLHLVFTRRVSRLVSAAKRFAAGDFSAMTGLQGKDELAQIGEAFDWMAGEIAKS